MSQNLFVANRDINVGSTLGHSIFFKKGIPQHAPREMHKLLIEKGILPADKDGNPVTGQIDEIVAEAPGVKMAPEEADERNDAILKVIEQIVKRNDAKDFAAGTPSFKAVSQALGWRTDQKEVRAVWLEHRAELIGAS